MSHGSYWQHLTLKSSLKLESQMERNFTGILLWQTSSEFVILLLIQNSTWLSVFSLKNYGVV
jgi:hypothetical protein